MHVGRLSLAGFRSYRSMEVAFPPGPQVIVGPNAAGKTNLLEALVVLGVGHSHRTTTDAELIGWDAEFARLEGELGGMTPSTGLEPSTAPRAASATATTLEVVLARTGASGGRKRIRVNGVPRRATALSTALPVVVFAPEDMLLVVGSPSLRRGVLDTLVAQREVMGAATLATYTRALQQRNTLLRAIREGLSPRDELAFWDATLVREGGRIVAWRRALLADLARPLADAHREIAPHEGTLELRYVTNAPSADGEDPEATLRRRLAETAEKEVWNGTTLVGPHRDDVAFDLDGRDLAGFASRGQQRTAILALKLAHLELLATGDGRPPLLLLDDVFSELDPDRRAHLVRRIGDLPQSFVTTTTLDDLDPRLVSQATSWRVEPGRLRPVGSRAGHAG